MDNFYLFLADSSKNDKISFYVFALGKHVCGEYLEKYASTEKMFPANDSWI